MVTRHSVMPTMWPISQSYTAIHSYTQIYCYTHLYTYIQLYTYILLYTDIHIYTQLYCFTQLPCYAQTYTVIYLFFEGDITFSIGPVIAEQLPSYCFLLCSWHLILYSGEFYKKQVSLKKWPHIQLSWLTPEKLLFLWRQRVQHFCPEICLSCARDKF